MMLVRRSVLLLALLASTLIAGFFYTYSISVMPGLAVTEPHAAMQAMQGINATIRTPIFAFAFFGAFGFTAAAAALAPRWAVVVPLMAGGLIYAAGGLALTFAVHVPMNESLALVDAAAADAVQIWQDYLQDWTAWNHVRAIASLLAFACVAAGAIADWRGEPATAAASDPSARAAAPAQ